MLPEEFLTLADAARLEGVDYDTIKKRVQRGTDQYITMEVQRLGRPMKLLAVASLSPKARRAWQRERGLAAQGRQTGPAQEAPPGGAERSETEMKRPWYVEVDHHWYIENYRDAYYKALALTEVVRELHNYTGADKTGFSARLAEQHGLTQRTLYRLGKEYLEGSLWAMKYEQLTGGNYDHLKVMALCRKPKDAGRFPSVSPEMKALIENIWFDKGFRSNRGTVTMLYDRLQEAALRAECACPSYQTVTRYINYLMEDKGGRTAAAYAEIGKREYMNRYMRKGLRDVCSLPVMGLVQGDEHTFDCWVSVRCPNGKTRPVRPVLVAWLEMRSRVIMGDIICEHPNAQILKQSMIKLVYGYGPPEYLLIDNGRDYTAREMTGRHRNDRGGLCFDSETIGFYRSLGVKDDMRALPYQPWVKAQIERFFGTVCGSFTKWLDSYTGTLTGSLTAGKIKKDVQGMHENGELLSLDAFYALWQKWVSEVYLRREHSGLRDDGERWIKPIELFENCPDRYERPAPPESYAEVLLMKAERCLVRNIGIKRWGNVYMADELCNYIKDYVDIRYNPEDKSKIICYTRDGKRICEAYAQQRLPVGYRLDDPAIGEHKRKQAAQIKREREKLAAWTTPFEDREPEEAASTARPVAGALEIGALTVKGERKVVALPADRQYREEQKARRQKPARSEYLDRRGAAALEKIKNLG